MPEDQNFIVTSLPEYVQENRDEILRVTVLGGNTIRRMVPQLGIKTRAKINYLEVDPEFQDGLGCGFTPQEGGIELTQREIATGIIKVNMTVCPDKLLGKYAEYLVKIGATEEELPFEQFIVDSIVEGIQAKLEKAVWLGDLEETDPNLNKFDGLLKLASGETATVKVTFAASASIWDKIKTVILAIPEEALDKGAVSVFVGADMFRSFMLEVVEKNLYHYSGPQDQELDEFVFPGTNVRVVKANGLNRTGAIYATYDRNMYFGTDMLANAETVKIWWSDDDDIFKIKVKFNAGVQTAFPDMVVLGAAGEAPAGTIVGPASLNMPASAGSVLAAYVASDGSEIAAQADADWLTASVDGGTVTFAASANETGAARTATVTITAGTASKQVTVNQAGA